MVAPKSLCDNLAHGVCETRLGPSLVSYDALSLGIDCRPARDSHSMAPPRVSALLALEVETGEATLASEHSRADCPNGKGESDLGARPRRLRTISEARDLRLATYGAGVLALESKPAMPDDISTPLADVRSKPRAVHRGLRLLSRCGGAVSGALRARNYGSGNP